MNDSWNDTAVGFAAKDHSLHRLFQEQVARTPDAPAVAFEGQRLTYAELDRRAEQLARRLRALGVEPDAPVALFMERSLEVIVGILGVLKAGAAYMPIDTNAPAQRIDYLLGDARARVLVTQGALQASLPPLVGTTVVDLDTFDWGSGQGPAQNAKPFDPAHVAYVIYTSGSTGQPKGVCIEHRNIVNYVLGVSERLRLEPGMHHALVSTMAADLGNTVLFPSLVTGGCLHVISRERAENQATLSEYFAREKIDVLKIVPSHLAALQAGRNPEQVMPRKRLVLGGEASRLDWIERLRAMAPGCEIFNHYGPTETTVGVLTYHVDGKPAGSQGNTLPIGKPLPNSRVYVLDEAGQPTQPGAQGEICIGGACVARGYLHRPELTAEKFVQDPFVPGARMYRTGDLARRLPDGNIEFCGRVDHQVKVHGYRVELGEIESAVLAQGGIREAVVNALDDGSGNKQLVAYIVPKRADQPLWDKSVHILPDGAPVAHLNRNETDYIYNEIFLLQAYIRHGVKIEDGDTILDAGANIGLFTTFANRLARNLRIISFEPNPTVHACVSANGKAYGTNTEVLQFGLSNESKRADLTFFEGLSLLSGVYADEDVEREMVKNYVFNQDAAAQGDAKMTAEIESLIKTRLQAKSESIELRTLSSVIQEKGLDRVDLLKVNVEKSELDVLKGIGEADWPKIRQLVIEIDLASNLDPIVALLKDHGYETYVEQDVLLRRTELCYVYAIRPSSRSRLIGDQGVKEHVLPVPPPSELLLTPATLRKHMKDRLPPYMVPSAVVLLEKIPLTSNGKVDRQALAQIKVSNAAATALQEIVKPQTQTQTALIRIWEELLEQPADSFGITHDFFDLGGHSLLAIRLVSRVRDVCGVDLQTQVVFENPTVASLGSVVDDLKSKAAASGAPSRAQKGPIVRQARRPAGR
jgi:amino acid adenylation domain-containing protein/FkbM family methyltransferase